MEYDIDVRRLSSLAVSVFSLCGLFLFFDSTAVAQINAPPSSVTSPGFGGRSVNGPPSSVTSVGPRGYAPSASGPFRQPMVRSHNGDTHRRRHGNGYIGPYLYAYPVPYAVDPSSYSDAPDLNADDSEYQGGPTVFDRRGSGSQSYIPPTQDAPAPHAAQAQHEQTTAPSSSPDSETAVIPTLLVFKDGHQLEIGNYAIVGVTLFDLTPGHSRKVALSDLDLEVTQKQNEDRGVAFQLPPSLQGN